eukprot:TRINITY_DN113999_c0_g1_i1.p1 TRINITY_DN113999_c0_g1~~TRINITY_DN113999_c0_g1_i1.p1  ORF type:complete len:378 (+),score=50.46 TRINITY_DN113999_c0_g1_i1:99-1232(+)
MMNGQKSHQNGSRSRSPPARVSKPADAATPDSLAKSWPQKVPFKGKPRHPEDGAVVDWCSLHLKPPSPATPWLPPFEYKASAGDQSGSLVFFDPTPEHTEGLRFAPWPHKPSHSSPAVLTKEQLDSWNKKGYLLPGHQVLSTAEAQQHARLWQEMLHAHGEGDMMGINGFFKRYGGAYDLVCHPSIVAIVRDLLGPNFACWGAHYICKTSSQDVNPIGVYSDGSPAWHQDAFFWPFHPNKSVIVWLALDDVDEENGGMRFFPGSHLNGCLHTDKEEVIRKSTIDHLQKECGSSVLAGPLRAGQVSIHSDLMVHGSPWNKSSRRRLGISIQYVPTDGIDDMGEGWGHGVAMFGQQQPDASPAQVFWPLARPTLYGPCS